MKRSIWFARYGIVICPVLAVVLLFGDVSESQTKDIDVADVKNWLMKKPVRLGLYLVRARRIRRLRTLLRPKLKPNPKLPLRRSSSPRRNPAIQK